MSTSALAMHDTLLLNAPDNARHDRDICPFCSDWAMTESGIPSGFGRLDEASRTAPYGDVEYADPGFQSDGVNRFPIDTEPHARTSWELISQDSAAEMYSDEQLTTVRSNISAALEKFGVSVKNDAASEGGTQQHMDTITQETHNALVEKALRDGTASLEADKAALEAKVTELETQVATLNTEKADLESKNEKLNADLDTAQLSLKAAQDETAALKADIAKAEEAALVEKIATERAEQVRNLGLFAEDYIVEKASRWASVDEAAWAERIEEWTAAKSTSTSDSASATTDTASAMTGTRNVQAGNEPSARRQLLGL